MEPSDVVENVEVAEAVESVEPVTESVFANMFDVSAAADLLDPISLVYLVVVLAVFWVGKRINDKMTPYSLSEELTHKDNKAVAMSFSGYLFALGIVLWGVLSSDSTVTETENMRRDLLLDIGNTALWGVIGIILLEVARVINDKVMLYQFNNAKELATDRNVGTGAVQAGAFIGTAFMIRASLIGDDDTGFAMSLVLALVYFVVGQIAFILFSKVYQMAVGYDLHEEIEKDNVAAGVSFGMTLVAVGIVLSGYIAKSDSLVGLAVWFVISSVVLIGCRALVDKLILPCHTLNDEISTDRNWGAAMVEGASALGLALLLTAAF